MEQYIPKSALVAKIEKRMDKNRGKQSLPQYFGMIEEDLNILSFINTLEVKEVDLDKEIGEYLSTYWHNEKELHPFLGHMAKHFFELGMQVSYKAQKGE